MLDLRDISKSFSNTNFFNKKYTHVLKKISFKLEKGDFLEVIGNNGSGKTTLLKIISGLVKEDTGSIVSPSLSKTYVSCSERAFFWRLTLMENLQFFFNIRHSEYTQSKHKLCLALLKRFNLQNHKEKLFMQLSSGQKKKVAIVSALLNDSDIFLFDEVTTSLDDQSKNELFNYLEQIKKNKVIIWATHDDEIKHIKTKTLLIKDGVANNV